MRYISNGSSIEATNGIAEEVALEASSEEAMRPMGRLTHKHRIGASPFGAGAARKLIQRAGVVALSGALVFAAVPASAIAETAATATQAADSSGQPGEPPSGGSSDSGQPGEPPSDGNGPGDDGQGGGGANTQSFDYSGTYSATLAADGEEVTSESKNVEATEADQNAALAQNGGKLAITGGTLVKSGDDTNGDNCNFYGLNSALLSVGEGSLATIADSSITTTSEGSNAIFATDSATVYATGVTINTSAGNSRGLDATYGGTIVASDITAATAGDHCATVATDRGGGYVSLTDSTLDTEGSGSPILYSTGDIEVNNVTGTASGSQIAGMEGLNTILINNSQLKSTNTSATASDPIANGIIIYQSTSGDAETTTGEAATFQAANSTLESDIESGSMFYLTNTSADVVLSNTEVNFDSSKAALITAAGNDSNSWGSAGSNGATAKFTAIGETLEGDVCADTISSVDLHLIDGTTWTGATSITENASATESSTTDAPITVNVDGTSTWCVSESCTLSTLNVADGASIVDEDGKTVTIVAGGQTVVEGDSDLTVTCDSYNTSYDASSASSLSTSLIDRTAYDAEMGTSTTWSMGDTTTQASATTEAATTDAAESASDTTETETNVFVRFFQWLSSIVGLSS